MRQAWYITAKELRSYFVSPVANIVVFMWLFVTGLFFYGSVTASQEASLNNVFGVITVLLIFAPPFLTMRLLAEESRMGTLELLLTAPVKDWAVVLGKFLAVLVLYASMIAPTLLYGVILTLFNGNPD